MFTRECIICLETKIRNYHRITSKCIHEVDVCLECINRYIDTNTDKFETIIQFDQNVKIKITCPVPICNKLMERDDVKKIATKEIYERFNNFLFIKKGDN